MEFISNDDHLLALQLKKISKNNLIGIEHKKNKSALLMGSKITLNSHGFRSDIEFKKNGKKILMLGDSMTVGWGAKKPFPNILNDKLTKHEVINAGIGNTNTLMQIENFFQNFKNLYSYEMNVNIDVNDFENIKVVQQIGSKNILICTLLFLIRLIIC